MRVVDLTHCISQDMPVYPGTDGPKIVQATTIEREGFAEKLISMFSHTGTHIDAPAHMIADAQTLDSFDAGRFIGAAAIVDVSIPRDGVIDADLVERNADAIRGKRFVLFRSAWSNFWGKPSYYEGFPVLSEEAARSLCDFGLHGIGVDMISMDRVDSKDFPVHMILLNRGLVIVENLTNLEAVGKSPFVFSCLPLKIPASDGSPVRAVAMIDEA